MLFEPYKVQQNISFIPLPVAPENLLKTLMHEVLKRLHNVT